MPESIRQLLTALKCLLLLTVVLGVGYPLLVLPASVTLGLHAQAHGSLSLCRRPVVGAPRLIGQAFDGRPVVPAPALGRRLRRAWPAAAPTPARRPRPGCHRSISAGRSREAGRGADRGRCRPTR